MANEKRLIDCEQAKRATYEEIFWTESEQAVVRNFLAKLPKADAVEVVHGRWDEHYDTFVNDNGYESEPIEIGWTCSACGSFAMSVSNYCPNCGAKMEGDWNA